MGISFRGLIDEPMMWNRALSSNEIALHYQSQQQVPNGKGQISDAEIFNIRHSLSIHQSNPNEPRRCSALR